MSRDNEHSGSSSWLACGCSNAAGVQFASASEAVVRCGNALVLVDVRSGQQRVLVTSGQGIQSFAASIQGGVIAVADQGFQPSVSIYATSSLQLLQSVHASTAFGYTALALSADGELLAVCGAEPDLLLTVWQWRKGVPLAGADLAAPVSSISFHPADTSYLVTTAAAVGPQGGASTTSHSSSSGGVHLWQLHRLLERHELQPVTLQLQAGCAATCHAWAPEGLYVGCADGSVACISTESGAVLHASTPAAGDGSAAAGVSSLAVNKHWLVAALAGCRHLTFLQRCPAADAAASDRALSVVGTLQVSTIGCQAVAFGGALQRDLLVSTLDGSLLLVSHASTAPPPPSELQVEPLADWHVGPIVGVAPAADGAHMLSCGADGSIRVWAAAAGAQLVNKRDVGGRLTAAAACGCPHPVLAVGSQAGVLRLLDLSNLQQLRVSHHARLFREPISMLAFSADGSHLAVAAARQQQVALLQQVAAPGSGSSSSSYVTPPADVLSMAWLPAVAGSAPLLLLSLKGGKLAVVAPAASPQSVVHAAATCVELRALAVLPQQPGSSSSVDVVGLSSDGHLHWLQLPGATASSWAGFAPAAGPAKALQSTSRLILPVPGVAMALSAGGHQLLVATQDGSLLMLPATAAAAEQAVASESGVAVTQPVLAADVVASAVLAFSSGGHWAAVAASDGSLVLHQTGAAGAPRAAPLAPAAASAAVQDLDAPDDAAAPTCADLAAAAAAAHAHDAAAGVRQATLQKLQAIQGRLAQVLAANAAAPPDQQLSGAELVLNTRLLAELQAQIAAEESQLLAEATRRCHEQEVQAARLKAMCWDAFEVKRAVCTGLRASEPQVSDFQLALQDDSQWAEVAGRRRAQVLAAHQHTLDQDAFSRSAVSSAVASTPGADAAAAAAAMAAAADTSAEPEGSGLVSRSGDNSFVSSQRSSIAGGEPSFGSCYALPSKELIALLLRLKDCTDARQCRAADLLLPELKVTTAEAKLMQAELYKRRAWELKTEFHLEFEALSKQKHADAERLMDLGSRADELIRELVKTHLLLAGPSPASDASAADTGGEAAGAAPAAGDGSVASAAQLSADLAAGRLVPHWSPDEDLAGGLLTIRPHELQACKYLAPAERAKAAVEEAAAEAAGRAAAADSSRDRALQQMMGGRLERSVDEVSELLTSRPAWMATADPSTLTEEQLRQYKEHQAKEAAAIEERLKRKGIMETELRTLKAAAEEVAAKFDAAVAALAAKRLDVLAEVTVLEGRMLRLLADEEVASVTAGLEVQQQAATKVSAARAALAAVEGELASTQQLLQQQQEALSVLHAEEKAADSGFKRQFGHMDAAPRLTALYKARLAPAHGSSPPAAPAASPSHGGRAGPSGRSSAIGPARPPSSWVATTSPRAAAAAGPDASAALVFAAQQLQGAHAPAKGKAPAASAAGAKHEDGSPAHHPLIPTEMVAVQLQDSQRPEGLDEGLWLHFAELHAARTQLELASREQAAQVACLRRALQLLQAKQSQAAASVRAAEAALAELQACQADAMQDVEVQLSLKQGQVECWPRGLAAIAPEALLVSRQQVKAVNSIVLAKGEAKLELLRQMKDFKRGTYELQWEVQKADMEAEDVVALTQQLQLLHVTKEFQQQVKAASLGAPVASSGGGGGGSVLPSVAAAAASSSSGGNAAAASREVASLENLLKVREALHASAVDRKRRALRAVEAQLAGKAHENATLALHLTGLERMLDEAARLRTAAASNDAAAAADRTARSLMMQSKLRDISEAQAAEIGAAQGELRVWQQRCYPCLPGSGGEDQEGDEQDPAGSDQRCSLPDLVGSSHGRQQRGGPASGGRAGRVRLPAVGGGIRQR